MGTRFTRLVGLAAILTLAAPTLARESEATDRPLAHELFDRGRALMEQGDYAHACELFEESRRLDPGGGGGGTVLNLALCHERAGRIGTAWALFRTARSLALRDRREDRQVFAEKHIAELAPRLSRIRIVVRPGASVAGLLVHRDAITLTSREWGEAMVVDPGPHIVTAEAPGHKPTRQNVDVRDEGVTRDVELLPLEPASRAPTTTTSNHPDPLFRIGGLALGGAGIATMGVGGFFALRAVDRQGTANDLCPNYDRCDPRGLSASSGAASDARVATVLTITGAVFVATGILLFLAAPHRTDVNQPAMATRASPNFPFLPLEF